VVLVEPRDAASRRDVKVADKTKVDLADGQLTVKTITPGDKAGSVVITISLPAGSSLAAYLAHSSVRVDGSVGQFELHMASGRVQLDRIDALRANISAGEVAVAHIAGRADIEGATFAVRIGEVDGPVGIRGTGGQAWIGHAAADLELSSSSGGFEIDRADGSVTATTASGAIRIGRMTHGQAKLMNGSGTIEVGISDGTAAYIDVNSERGAVRDSVASPSPESPDASGATVMIHARTRHGDIIIQRAAG
jgi:DUF4097 and DUF4098 domain-containing protein YvlB